MGGRRRRVDHHGAAARRDRQDPRTRYRAAGALLASAPAVPFRVGLDGRIGADPRLAHWLGLPVPPATINDMAGQGVAGQDGGGISVVDAEGWPPTSPPPTRPGVRSNGCSALRGQIGCCSRAAGRRRPRSATA
ncbi:hypothetical protein ACFSTI_08350 [Rhizorhabdus histidinilytica]